MARRGVRRPYGPGPRAHPAWVGAGFVTEDVDGARGTLRRYAERQAADGARLYGIWLDGTLVGGVMFTDFSTASGSCEVGCWLEPAAEGHGVVTEACQTLLDWAFVTRGLHRAEWHCRPTTSGARPWPSGSV